jgi:hypothetical protein
MSPRASLCLIAISQTYAALKKTVLPASMIHSRAFTDKRGLSVKAQSAI